LLAFELLQLLVTLVTGALSAGRLRTQARFAVRAQLLAPLRQVGAVDALPAQQGGDLAPARAAFGLAQDAEFLLGREATALTAVLLGIGYDFGVLCGGRRLRHESGLQSSPSLQRLPGTPWLAVDRHRGEAVSFVPVALERAH